MNNAIQNAFVNAAARGRSAFIPYITGGFPDMAECADVLAMLADGIADIIEIGLPFSDPLADGPTIQQASTEALRQGTTPDDVFDVAERTRVRSATPLVIMTYVNPVLAFGYETFARRAAEVGVSGVIIPDLPPEEADEWIEAARRRNLDTIFLVSPNTPMERVRQAAELSTGFLYYVSVTGVTGAALKPSGDLGRRIAQTRALSSVPTAVGFGIGTPEQARELAPFADGVIVGSALIRVLQTETDSAMRLESATTFCRSIRDALFTFFKDPGPAVDRIVEISSNSETGASGHDTAAR